MWPNFTEPDQSYKIIKSGLLETKQYPRYAQCAFWEDFVPVLERQSGESHVKRIIRTQSAVCDVLGPESAFGYF